METIVYNSFYLQAILFALLAVVLLICALSVFIKPAKRIIRASLVDAKSGHIFDISHAETSIGRSRSCDIVLEDISVSRFHAVLSMRSKSWMIFDTNSTGGVFVNGKRIDKKQDLKDGDRIKFGNTLEYIFYSTAVTTRKKKKTPVYNYHEDFDDSDIDYNPRPSNSGYNSSYKNNINDTDENLDFKDFS